MTDFLFDLLRRKSMAVWVWGKTHIMRTKILRIKSFRINLSTMWSYYTKFSLFILYCFILDHFSYLVDGRILIMIMDHLAPTAIIRFTPIDLELYIERFRKIRRVDKPREWQKQENGRRGACRTVVNNAFSMVTWSGEGPVITNHSIWHW